MVKQSKEQALYTSHLQSLLQNVEPILEDLGYKSLIVFAGSEQFYFCDDTAMMFRLNPYFAYFCPLQGANHFLKIEIGQKPKLFFFYPSKDFWENHPHVGDYHLISEKWDIEEYEDVTKIWNHLSDPQAAFIGATSFDAKAFFRSVNSELLLTRLDWLRRIKSPFEIHCLKKANEIAAKGHKEVVKGFAKNESEFALYLRYLEATGQTSYDFLYEPIIGLNENASTLHYRSKNRQSVKSPLLCLIDAGATYLNYSSDITRTHINTKTPSLFKDIYESFTDLQKDLCQKATVTTSFKELNLEAHYGIAKILEQAGVFNVKGDYEFAYQKGLTKAFFPHSLGHMLGLQVHDVGGHLSSPNGSVVKTRDTKVRSLAKFENNQVITIEPGLYFIEPLLKMLKEKEEGKHVSWSKVESLMKWGGIRIEDNVVICDNDPINLTRAFLD
jgi:Xaa-Pro dipeptidase